MILNTTKASMKTYKFWAKSEIKTGSKYFKDYFVFSGSNISPSDAQNMLNKKMETLKDRYAGVTDSFSSKEKRREYELEIREEVLEEVSPENIITRNRYGAEILNTTEISIFDIDLKAEGYMSEVGILGWFRGLKPNFTETKSLRGVKQEKVEDIENIFKEKYSELECRIYETYKGLRLIIQNTYIEPNKLYGNLFVVYGNNFAENLFAQIVKDTKTDLNYALLCLKQKCFRARLSPKPYRMKEGPNSIIYKLLPEPKEKVEQEIWLNKYNQIKKNYSVCIFLKTVNSRKAEISEIIKLHDEKTGVANRRPLA